jgi:hypothetical protein
MRARSSAWAKSGSPRSTRWNSRLGLVCISVCAVSCTANIGNSGGGGGRAGTAPTGTNPIGTNPTGTNPTGTNPTGANPTGTGGGPAPTCTSPRPGTVLVRRLNRFEYNNTVRDLLNDSTSPANALPPEENASGFDNNAFSLNVDRYLSGKYLEVAEGIATRSTQDLPGLLGCDPVKVGEDVCVKDFIARFGARAYRRPLEDAEAARLWTVFSKGRLEEPLAGAVSRVVSVVLQTPQFLYRLEPPLGTPDAVLRLDPWQTATRLSYLFWGSMPDDALFTAARSDTLKTNAQIEAQARRLLADPKARAMVTHFHRNWLKLDDVDRMEKDALAFPSFTPALRPLFSSETEAFTTSVVFDGKGDLATLLTAPYTFVNATLANFYGLTGVTGDTFQKVALNPAQRSGVLTQASLMARLSKVNRTEPIKRGLFVRENLFCAPPPAPPAAALANAPTPPPGLTGREMLAFHRNDPSCGGCHQQLDPIGLGFENIDGIGQWRESENGAPVDASGEIIGTDVPGKFVGPVELAQKLAQSEQVAACVMGKWFVYAAGRGVTGDDACSQAQLEKVWNSSHHNFKELLVGLTQTDAFLYTRNSP